MARLLINYLILLSILFYETVVLNLILALWRSFQPITDGHFSVENLLPLFSA
jgi:hypothetical protein